jgi:hypothetical protein
MQEVTSSRPIKQLVVSAISKEVRLPENEVTLSAFTVPAEQPGIQFFYIAPFRVFIHSRICHIMRYHVINLNKFETCRSGGMKNGPCTDSFTYGLVETIVEKPVVKICDIKIIAGH